MKRRTKIALIVTLAVLIPAGFVAYIVFRDDRSHHLWPGTMATISLSEGGAKILDTEFEKQNGYPPAAMAGDRIKILGDRWENGWFHKVDIKMESGQYQGIEGTIGRMWLRPDHWWIP